LARRETELSPRTFCTLWARVVVTPDGRPASALRELSGVSGRPMMPLDDTARPQRRDDHQLRDLVQRTGDLTIATDLGVPRSTARGWLDAAPTVVVSLDWANLTEPAERRELLDASPHLQDLLSEFPVGAGPLADLRVQALKERVCRTDHSSCGSCAPWIRRASVSRCKRSSGSCVSRRVGSMPGAGCRGHVRLTIDRRPRTSPHRLTPRSRRSDRVRSQE
jgi:hypothetical protein